MSPKSELKELIPLRTLEKIQDNFSDATGISCVVRDIDGKQITKFSNPSRLWLEISKHKEIETELTATLLENLKKSLASGQNIIYKRYLDTYAFASPININGQIKAFFIGGLVRFGNPNLGTCQKEAERLNIDIDTFLEMYLELPFVKKEKFESAANLLKTLGSIFSTSNPRDIKEHHDEIENTIKTGTSNNQLAS